MSHKRVLYGNYWLISILDESAMEVTSYVACLLPSTSEEVDSHPTVFVNELKLSDFKQVLSKSGIPSEFSGGVLWCAQGTIALRRVRDFL